MADDPVGVPVPDENRRARVVALWQRVVQSDGEWTRVAWTCPTCGRSLFDHPSTFANPACALTYAEAERLAYEAVKTLVGAGT